MTDFRQERIGVTHAARLLGISVTELKDAVRQGSPIHDVTLPMPMVYGAGGRQYYFLAGEIMDCAETIQARRQGARQT